MYQQNNRAAESMTLILNQVRLGVVGRRSIGRCNVSKTLVTTVV